MVAATSRPERRDEVMRALSAAPEPLTIDALAGLLDVHPNTIRFHLESLLAAGRVRRVAGSQRGPGRPAGRFAAVRGMDPTGPRNYRLLATVLDDALGVLPDAEVRAVAAGRALGTRLAESAPASALDADERLIGLLDREGFAPERAPDDRDPDDRSPGDRGSDRQLTINLRHCPFLELAESGSSLVCRAHLGLMRGALQAWQAPYVVDRLDAFVEPDVCRAHLTMSGAVG